MDSRYLAVLFFNNSLENKNKNRRCSHELTASFFLLTKNIYVYDRFQTKD